MQVREGGKYVSYVMVVDAAGLVALAQMGVLEIHPWGSRADHIDQPDMLIFDMDPGDGVGWRRIVEAAAHTRVFLHELGLTSFVKTTGGKGLHVVVPIVPHDGWDDVKAFTEGVARMLARRNPELFVAKMGKAARPNKIYVDYVRNTRGQTAVGAYSTRARPGAPVSTPMRWDEILGEEAADHWTVKNLPRRLAALKEDPWAGFATMKQRLTPPMRREVERGSAA